MTSPILPTGHYYARAVKARHSSTSDGLPYVEVELAVFVQTKNGIEGYRLSWRGWKTAGAAPRTIAALVAMGVSPIALELDPNSTAGLGSRRFGVFVESVLCDELEAPGSFKTFVRQVKTSPAPKDSET